MVFKAKNSKSKTKNIRFPHQLLNEIYSNMTTSEAEQITKNFSAWVIDACKVKLTPNDKAR